MNLTTWLAVVSICALGAMSPGPSLAVVMRHTLTGGRTNGMIAAVTHGLGLGLYALACISGVAFVLVASPTLFNWLQWLGAAYLFWLGIKGILAHAATPAELPMTASTAGAARDGFMIVFLNPKIAVFFIALFSQVIGPETTLLAKLGYAMTALIIDMGWYALVAWGLSNPRWLPGLQRHSVWLDRLFGALLIALALRLAWTILP